MLELVLDLVLEVLELVLEFLELVLEVLELVPAFPTFIVAKSL